MQFIGGASQQQYVEKTRGMDPARCLAAGVDVGKSEALCLIADHRGEVVGEALTFPLTEPGVQAMERLLATAAGVRSALSVRIGVETAGHYHRPVVSRLVAASHDVVELNPAHVKAARARQGARRLKTDLRDAAAIADLVISGSGRPPQQRADALVEQQVWAAVRRRRVHARTALTNQLLGTLDLVFPGLDGCFHDLLATQAGPVLLRELADPDRLHRLGVEGLRAFIGRRGVRLHRRKAEQLHQAAADALRLPGAERACRAAVLATDLAMLDVLDSGDRTGRAAAARRAHQHPRRGANQPARRRRRPGLQLRRGAGRAHPLPQRRAGLPRLRAGPLHLRIRRPHPQPSGHQP